MGERHTEKRSVSGSSYGARLEIIFWRKGARGNGRPKSVGADQAY